MYRDTSRGKREGECRVATVLSGRWMKKQHSSTDTARAQKKREKLEKRKSNSYELPAATRQGVSRGIARVRTPALCLASWSLGLKLLKLPLFFGGHVVVSTTPASK